MCFVGLN